MRRNLQRIMVVLAAMISCLDANAIDKVVKKSEMKGEIISVADLATSTFMLQNGEGNEAVVLYTPSGWDIKVAPLAVAAGKADNGGFYKLETFDTHYLIPVYNIDKSRRTFWAGEQYVNSQPTGGNVIFGLSGTNDQHGQDGPNLALWDITYEEGQGFVFHCVGRDVYIGHDGTAARPSEGIVYWKAYTSYILGYDSDEVTAAYNEALAAAKSVDTKAALAAAAEAYASDNNLDKYGDAVNAVIDAINAEAVINAEYSNLDLDETGAAIAAEVPNKYNAGEYKNATELRAAYISAVKSQNTAGANMTGAIINPSFELGTLEGWTSTNGGSIATNYNYEYRTGNKFVERWTNPSNNGKLSDGSLLQTLTGMPNGQYTLTAELRNREQGNNDAVGTGFYLVANDDKTAVKVDGETVVVNTVVTNGTITIGTKLEDCSGNWICIDNFQLTLIDVLPTYTITIADDIENGTVKATPAEAVEGATVTLVITPAEGYELGTVTVKDAEDNDVAVSEKHTFIMPATAVTIAATFVKTYADVKLTYVDGSDATADTAYGEVTEALIGYNKIANGNVALANKGWNVNKIGYVKVDASKFNGTITSAKMTAEVSGCDGKRTAGWGVGYNSSEWSADLTYNTADKSITPVGTEYWTTTKAANVFEPVEFDITEAFAEGNVANILVYELAAGGGTIRNIKVAVEYIPGAPQIANASFEADGEKATSNGPLTITGWTETIDGVYNNTELRPANSESTTSQFGTSAPSDGDFSLFVRHGWNNNATNITFTSDALAEIPAGDYMLSVDYKQHYSWDNTQNNNTKVNIALVNGENTIGFATSPAAEGVQGDKAGATYFNDTEWSTLTATFTLAEAVPAGAKVVITLDARGQRRSDFLLDNVQFVKVPGVELALIDLKKAIEEAEATVPTYPVGDGLFQYAEAEITPLTEAIATAQAAYDAAESKEAVEAATKTLNAFVADFAPKATTPDAEKQYTLKNKQANLYMTLSEAGISIADEPYALTFEATDGGKYYLTDGEYYVGLGTNNYDMSSAADKKEALAISCTVVEGVAYYTLGESKGMVGVDYPKKSNMGCWADKGTNAGDAVLWTIEEVSTTATMSVKAGKWGTFVAPFDVTLPEGVKAYTVTGVENDQIVKEEVEETIPANTPVVLLNETEGDIEETITGASLPKNKTVTEGLLTGIYQDGADIPTGSYVLQTQDGRQAFYHVAETTAIKSVANRCYLTMSAGSAPLRAIFLGNEEGTTGIEAAEATSAENGILYNLAGQKVDASYKGIVIKKGKVMLKK